MDNILTVSLWKKVVLCHYAPWYQVDLHVNECAAVGGDKRHAAGVAGF